MESFASGAMVRAFSFVQHGQFDLFFRQISQAQLSIPRKEVPRHCTLFFLFFLFIHRIDAFHRSATRQFSRANLKCEVCDNFVPKDDIVTHQSACRARYKTLAETRQKAQAALDKQAACAFAF